jgi:hypothetical protein
MTPSLLPGSFSDAISRIAFDKALDRQEHDIQFSPQVQNRSASINKDIFVLGRRRRGSLTDCSLIVPASVNGDLVNKESTQISNNPSQEGRTPVRMLLHIANETNPKLEER